MNRKGFTLVELLGVIIILSIIMIIAIPNITSLTQKNKKNTYISDARKMVSLAQYHLRKGNYDKPNTNVLRIITLGSLSTTDVEKNSDGNAYDEEESYVVVYRGDDEYLYYGVQLVVKNGNTYDGIMLTRSENLERSEKYNHYKEGLNSSPFVSANSNDNAFKTALADNTLDPDDTPGN